MHVDRICVLVFGPTLVSILNWFRCLCIRRKDTLPLVFETFNWEEGTFMGSIMRSQATSASDQSGMVNDPMAMKAFCGYNISVGLPLYWHSPTFGIRHGIYLYSPSSTGC